jgi:hypothetical protein
MAYYFNRKRDFVSERASSPKISSGAAYGYDLGILGRQKNSYRNFSRNIFLQTYRMYTYIYMLRHEISSKITLKT